MNIMQNSEIIYKQNTADYEAIFNLLLMCDKFFVPPLGKRVNIRDYAMKLYTKSIRTEAFLQKKLTGLVCFYIDNKKQCAFITNCCVHPEYYRKHIAKNLLIQMQQYSESKKVTAIRLEVAKDNNAAISLYRRFGFRNMDSGDELIVMQKETGNAGTI